MKFEFHSKMRLILSNSVANLLRIVSQVSYLYLTGYNSQFISIKYIKNTEPRSSSTVYARSTCVKDALRLRKTLQQRRKLISFQREYLRNQVNAQTFTGLLNGQTCLWQHIKIMPIFLRRHFFMPKNKLGSLTGCWHRQSAMSILLSILEVNFENDALVSGCFS